MKLYKLTDADGYTRRGKPNETLWGENVTHSAKGTGGLCTDGVIHAYEHPLLAAFMNRVHANFPNPILWEADGEPTVREGQLKCGVKNLTTLRRVELPTITIEQRIRVAIGCALAQYQEPAFVLWAERWLDGSDRSEAAAVRAAEAAEWAASAAARAAEAAEWAASAVVEARAARAAAVAADWAAARAAEAEWARVARSARAAASGDLDLLSILVEECAEQNGGKA